MTQSGRKVNTRGMVTFELAVGILAAAVLTSILVWTVSLVGTANRCHDSATQMARQLARGDEGAARQVVRPNDATFQVRRGAQVVEVMVSAERRLGPIGPVRLAGHASAAYEPGVTP